MAGERTEGFEHLERAVVERARLLMAERVPAVDGTDEDQVGAAFLLTFDVGHLLVSAKPEAKCLHVLHIEDKQDAPGNLVNAAEEEPWWRVLGSPIVRAACEADGRWLRLQMRADEDDPRFVLLSLVGETVRAGLGR